MYEVVRVSRDVRSNYQNETLGSFVSQFQREQVRVNETWALIDYRIFLFTSLERILSRHDCLFVYSCGGCDTLVSPEEITRFRDEIVRATSAGIFPEVVTKLCGNFVFLAHVEEVEEKGDEIYTTIISYVFHIEHFVRIKCTR